jgi:hypothetical protein
MGQGARPSPFLAMPRQSVTRRDVVPVVVPAFLVGRCRSVSFYGVFFESVRANKNGRDLQTKSARQYWLRGRLRAIGDTCPGGRGMISQQNGAHVPREKRKWYG